MKELPDFIATQIFHYSSLESIVALGQTCKSFRAFFTALEDTVRDKVLERVPWMKKDEPGTQLMSWKDCALVVVARSRNKGTTQLTEYLTNAKITYMPGNNINCKELPESFKPMFDTFSFPQPTGEIRGQYMELRDDFLDLVSFDAHKEMPLKDPIAQVWAGIIHASPGSEEYNLTCPLSGITVRATKPILLWQESDRWLAISYGDYLYIVKKPDSQELVFDETRATLTLPKAHHIQLLPGSDHMFVFDFLTEEKFVGLSYMDLAKDTALRALTTFPGHKKEYDYTDILFHRSDQPNLSRDLVVPYGGLLWLHYKEKTLVPLYVDFAEEFTCYVSTKIPCVRVQALKAEAGRDAYCLGRSSGGRMVAHRGACGRMIGDLATGTTYIVRDKGFEGRIGACFVSKEDSECVPKFYTIDLKWCRGMELCWEHPDDTSGPWQEEEETPYNKENYLEYLEDNCENEDIWNDDNMPRVTRHDPRVEDQHEV